MKDNSAGRIVELDSLRGIAAVAVVIFHLLFMKPEFKVLYTLGFWGVALFFIISGYVISLTVKSRPSVGRFLLNRVSRLYPAYWFSVFMIAAIGFVVTHGKINTDSIIANLTMFQHWFGFKDMDSVYWTLKIELCFYLLIVFLLLMNQIQWIEIWGGVFLILFIIFKIFHHMKFTGIYGNLTIHYFPIINGFYAYFYSGILFYKITEYGKINFGRAMGLLASLGFAIYTMEDFGNVHFEFVPYWIYVLLILSCYAMFFLLFAGKMNWANHKVFTFLGKISYSLYITHFYLSFCFLIPNLEKRAVHWILARLITLVIIFVLAYCVNNWVEIPMMKYIRKFLPKKPAHQASLVS